MKIAVIGTGRVGSTLAKRWAALGHQIMFGTRDANSEKVQALLKEIEGARAGNVREAVTFGEVALVAVPGKAVTETIAQCGDLRGKIVIDAANWFGERPAGVVSSIAEEIARRAPGARVVKAFNTTGAGNMANPRYIAQNADMLICGDDADAKAAVADLASSIGFDVVDAGPLSAASHLEHLAQLWVHLAHQQGMGASIAWKLLKR